MKWLNVLFLVLIVGIILGGSYYYVDGISEKGKLLVRDGVYIEGESVTGMTKEELANFIQKKSKMLNAGTVSLKLNDQQKTFKWSQLGIIYQDEKLVNEIFSSQTGTTVDFIKRKVSEFTDGKSTEKEEFVIEPVFEEKTFNKMFEESFPKIVQKPVNASLSVSKGAVNIKGGIEGLSVNSSLLKQRVLEANIDGEKVVVVPTVKVAPSITTEDIKKMGIKEKIASYKTNFNPSDSGKVHNMALASKSINGVILQPGEEFDYHKIVGPARKSRGYVSGKAFSKGEIIDEVGGGICQTSSTLYNTALLAGMNITERHKHGLPVSYVPLGRDATLWYGSLNFKFKNTSKHSVYIEVVMGKSTYEVNMYGTKPEYDYYIESEMLEKVSPAVEEIKDSGLAAGETRVESAGSYGYRSVAYLIKKKDGKVISRDELSRDNYKALKRVIHVGPTE